ncbi:MAG: threonine--tRNA ligase [Pseudomonadota bacterium]
MEKGDKQLLELERLRHSAAHVMADAVRHLFPGVKIAIGPAVEDGFYYDFDFKRPFSPEDLARIEGDMQHIVDANLPFECKEVTRQDAKEIFKGEPYKLELIEELPEDEIITIYSHGDFVDLCKGPHVNNTSEIGAFKLLSVAGAYWRGDEKNAQLQRIYGTAFFTKEELNDYLAKVEEAARRDHRLLGKELELFSTMEEMGPGLVLWHPKGARIRRVIEDFWREAHAKNGYEILYTPHIARLELWKRSGHWDFYRENMYAPMLVDDIEYELKPMNCPFHIEVYKTRLHSYREFPIRWAELGTVYRYERSGVLHGLMRVRGFTQDDAHIFCKDDQLEEEIRRVLDFSLYVLRSFGFSEYDIYLSTKPKKHVGSDRVWMLAEDALTKALEGAKLDYSVDPGEGVFYGPKIDIKIKDSLGRAWQCTTIQVDFNLPERYHMEYVGKDGARHQPIMIHRALMGSLERFFGVLIEHYAGAFPTWLAPVQTSVITVSEAQADYAAHLVSQLREHGIRAELDDRNEKLGFKIREGRLSKVPYMLVIGAKETEAGTVAVRSRNDGDLGTMNICEFLEKIEEEIEKRVC